MASQAFEFHSPRGYVLSGRIELPETTPRGWAILAHCFTCGKESLAAVRVGRALALNGIGVLRFDFAFDHEENLFALRVRVRPRPTLAPRFQRHYRCLAFIARLQHFEPRFGFVDIFDLHRLSKILRSVPNE